MQGTMRIKAPFPLRRAVLVVILSLTLVAAGFGHRMPPVQDEAFAFALANGATAADFCGDGFGGDAKGLASCLACQIVAGPDTPCPKGARIDLRLAFDGVELAPLARIPVSRTRDPGHLPQGPPAV